LQRRFSFLFAFILSVCAQAAGQVAVDTPTIIVPDSVLKNLPDSVQKNDSAIVKSDSALFIQLSDSVSKKPVAIDSIWQFEEGIPLQQQILRRHPYFDFKSKPVSFRSDIKPFKGKERLFYVLVALLLIFALLKTAFAKYINDLFRVFFRTTLKQRQIKEQLIQTPLPSLLFNIFFIASAGLYANFMLHYFEFTPVSNFWLLYLYCCLGLAVIYFFKFIGLKVCGWLFNMQQAADAYIFIVFIINKVIGISLLPFIILLAFSDEPAYSTSIVLSWCCIAGLFLYRFILGYSAIHKEVRFNLFHFFLYLCAFEVAPLLLIYKLLLFFL